MIVMESCSLLGFSIKPEKIFMLVLLDLIETHPEMDHNCT